MPPAAWGYIEVVQSSSEVVSRSRDDTACDVRAKKLPHFDTDILVRE
jgi:hypothetical protein